MSSSALAAATKAYAKIGPKDEPTNMTNTMPAPAVTTPGDAFSVESEREEALRDELERVDVQLQPLEARLYRLEEYQRIVDGKPAPRAVAEPAPSEEQEFENRRRDLARLAALQEEVDDLLKGGSFGDVRGIHAAVQKQVDSTLALRQQLLDALEQSRARMHALLGHDGAKSTAMPLQEGAAFIATDGHSSSPPTTESKKKMAKAAIRQAMKMVEAKPEVLLLRKALSPLINKFNEYGGPEKTRTLFASSEWEAFRAKFAALFASQSTGTQRQVNVLLDTVFGMKQ